MRETDTVARLGGDEFTILLENLNAAEDAHGVGEKIMQVMQLPFVVESRTLPVSTSIGIMVSDGVSATAEEVMKKADSAMYEANRTGRNLIVIHCDQDNAASRAA